MATSKQHLRWRQQSGLSNLELLRLKESVNRVAEQEVKEMGERAFLYMLAIPLNVLVAEYWPKSAKQKAPRFIEQVIELYEAVQAGSVSEDDLAALLDDMAGVKVTAEWLKGRER